MTDTRSSTSTRTILCRLEDIADGGSKEIMRSENERSLCLVREGNTVYAYVNSCPHTGAPLNWDKDNFLNWEGNMIQCSLHGALFRIIDGLCVWGPCLQRHLSSVAVAVVDGAVVLLDAEPTPTLR